MSVHAEPELRARLSTLAGRDAIEQDDADAMLARIAWSRIAEPGDGVAGEFVAALGAIPALQLLIEGAGAGQIRRAASAVGLELSARAATAAHGRWIPRLNRSETVGDIEHALAAALRCVIPGSRDWPVALNDLAAHAPLLLWVRGNPESLSRPSLSVVGARAATGYGTHITAEIVDGVCAAGVSIVSGAAYGIDAVAHRSALAVEGTTVAVLAGGADRAYPQAHDSLLTRVSESGAVCAEMAPGSAPTRWRFLMRNRIIAALSAATLVTEAGIRSGSLNTAGHATELSRPVGAVPGPVTSPASAGCHKLIREYDAALIANATEALELIGAIESASSAGAHDHGGADHSRPPSVHGRVLDALPLRGARTAREIARLAGLEPKETRATLAELELLQQVTRRSSSSNGEGDAVWALTG